MPTAAELIIKITTLGSDELAKVATATQSVGEGTRLAGAQLKTFESTLTSLVGSGKSFKQALEEMTQSQGVLSNAVRSTSAALLDQIKAAEGDTQAMRKLTGAQEEFTGSTLQARAALQALNGQFSVRSAAAWLASIQGLGSVLATALPVIGLVAFGDELYKLYQKYDPSIKAATDLANAIKKSDEAYQHAADSIERYKEAKDRADKGPGAARADAAAYAGTKRDDVAFQLRSTQARIAEISRTAGAGLSFGNSKVEPTQKDQDEQHLLRIKVQDLQRQLQVLDAAKEADTAEAKHDDGKSGESLGKRQAQELITLQAQLGELQSKELIGIDAINVRCDTTIKKLQQEKLATQAVLDVVNQIANVDIALNFHKALDAGQKAARSGAKQTVDEINTSDNQGERYQERTFLENLRKERAQLEKDITAANQVLLRGDQSDIDQVQQNLNVHVSAYNRAVKAGTLSGAGATNDELQARIAAANEIFQIETRHLDLIDDEGKRQEALATARKKYADEIYKAEAQNEEALDQLRTQDLAKYHSEAGKIFDALTNRRQGAGFSITQLVREEAVSTGRQVFSNATAPLLQSAGHVLGSVTGGSSLGGLLNGTVFDPKNQGVDTAKAADTTAKQTTRTADGVEKLRLLLTGGVDTTNPQNAAGTSAAGAASSGLAGLTLTATSPLAALKSILGLGSSSPSSSPVASITSGADASSPVPGLVGVTAGDLVKLSTAPGSSVSSSSSSGGLVASLTKLLGLAPGTSGQFTAGLSSVGSGNALPILLGQNTTGPTGIPAQIGAGVGLATTVATEGLGIASGIKQGGPQGDLKAAGSAAGLVGTAVSSVAKLIGAASPLLSAIPIVGSIAAAALPLIGSLFGTGPAKREKDITNELAKNQYLAPTALNTVQGPGGNYEDFDARGLLRTSTLSALPTVAQPYITSKVINGQRVYSDVPGSVITPYSGTATGTGQGPIANTAANLAPQPAPVQVAAPAPSITIHMNAIDTQSGIDFITKNHAAVGEALATHLQTHEGRASNEIRNITGTGRN